MLRNYLLGGLAGAVVAGATAVVAGASMAATPPPWSAPPAATTSYAGAFYSLEPVRVFDTRDGTGTPGTQIGPHQSRTLQLGGRAGVPGSGVSAVVVNLTATRGTAPTALTLSPSGRRGADQTSGDVAAGADRADMVTVPLGAGGLVEVVNKAGSVDVVVDLLGFYVADDSAVAAMHRVPGGYHPLSPRDVFDSTAYGYSRGAGVSAMQTVDVHAALGAASAHVRALVTTITASGTAYTGHVTAWSGASASPPRASTLNYRAGGSVTNMAIVPVTPCAGACPGAGLAGFTLQNRSSGSAQIVVSVVGYVDDGSLTTGLRFRALDRVTRVVDTRTGLGGATSSVGQTQTVSFAVVSVSTTGAVMTRTTLLSAGGRTDVTLWAPATDEPRSRTRVAGAGESVSGPAIIEVDWLHRVLARSAEGRGDLVVDAVGTFDRP